MVGFVGVEEEEEEEEGVWLVLALAEEAVDGDEDWRLATALPVEVLARETDGELLEDAADVDGVADVDSDAEAEAEAVPDEPAAEDEPDADLLLPVSAALEHVLPVHFWYKDISPYPPHSSAPVLSPTHGILQFPGTPATGAAAGEIESPQ